MSPIPEGTLVPQSRAQRGISGKCLGHEGFDLSNSSVCWWIEGGREAVGTTVGGASLQEVCHVGRGPREMMVK